MSLSDTDVIRVAQAICAEGGEIASQFKFLAIGRYLDRVESVEKKIEELNLQKLRGVTMPEVERVVSERINASNETRNKLLKDRFSKVEEKIANPAT